MLSFKIYPVAIAIASLVACTCAQSGHAAEDITQKLKKTDDLLTRGRPKAAALLLREMVKQNPDNSDAHMQLGAAMAALVENDKYDGAIAEEQTALKLDPKSYGARKILGHIYANMHKLQESIVILKEACDLKPSSYGAQRDLGTAYLAAGSVDESIVCFKKAIELKPTSVEAHLKLSALLSRKGELKEAIAVSREAVKIGGNKADTHLALANLLLESGDNAGSIESFKDAIAANGYDSLGCLNPLTAANAYSGLGWATAAAKDSDKKTLDEAIADQRKAIKAYPPFILSYSRMADLLARQGKNKDAEVAYQKGLFLSQGDAGIATAYARFLDAQGRKDEARKILKHVLEKSPTFKPASEAMNALEQSKGK